MKIDEKEKVNILLGLLGERYDASHRMRERSLNFAVWILGFGVAITWLLLSGITLTASQKVVLTILVAAVSGLTIYFVGAIEKGFNANRKVMIDIEEALGCYAEGAYVPSKALFPDRYAETKRDWMSHFVTIYIWTIAISVIVILLIWLSSGQPQRQKERSKSKGVTKTGMRDISFEQK